jgi:hypothetical protein
MNTESDFLHSYLHIWAKTAQKHHIKQSIRNKRAGLKIRFREECRFESDRPHHFDFNNLDDILVDF